MGDFKLVHARNDARDGARFVSGLYNLATDVSESKDLSDSMPDKVKELKAVYEAWNKELVAPAWGHPRTNAKAADPKKAKKKA